MEIYPNIRRLLATANPRVEPEFFTERAQLHVEEICDETTQQATGDYIEASVCIDGEPIMFDIRFALGQGKDIPDALKQLDEACHETLVAFEAYKEKEKA